MTSRRHRHGPSRRPDPLGRLVRDIARGRAKRPVARELPSHDLDARLDALEQDVREVRTRINALFFAVLTAALGDLAGRVVL